MGSGKMPEQVQKIWNQIVEGWKKFSTKQKVVLKYKSERKNNRYK